MSSKKTELLKLIVMISLFLYFVFSNLSNHNIYSDITIIVLSFFSIVMMLFYKKVHFDSYFIFYLLFVVYELFMISIGKVSNTNATVKIISTLMINFSIYLMVYNIIINISNIDLILKIYIYSSFISLSIIMFLLRHSLFTGRLAHAYGEGSVSFYFLGKAIAISSNGIAFYAAASMLICLYFLVKSKKIKYLIIALFFSLGCIMTGSRKGILLLVIYIILFINHFYKGKFLKKGIIISLIMITLYFVIIKIPALYNILGLRVEALINKLIGIGTKEGSVVARERYKNLSLVMIPKRLWFGYGCGYFSYLYGNITEINYLELLVSGGIIGLIIYYIRYISIIIKHIKYKLYFSDATKILFILFISIIVYDIGSVTYAVRNILIVIVLYLASKKIDIMRSNKDE